MELEEIEPSEWPDCGRLVRVPDGVTEELRRLRPAMFGYAQRRLRNRDDSEDAVQETHVRIWRRLDRFDASRPFEPWAYKLLMNVVRDAYRAQSRHNAKFASSAGMFSDANEGDATDFEPRTGEEFNPLAQILRDCVDPRIVQALDTLPGPYRDAMICNAVRGWDYNQIAERRGLPLGTVRSRIHRGRMKLQDVLGPYLVDILAGQEPGQAN